MSNEQSKEFKKYTQFSLVQDVKPKPFLDDDSVTPLQIKNDNTERDDSNRHSGNN